jgi:hypothetical protein
MDGEDSYNFEINFFETNFLIFDHSSFTAWKISPGIIIV